MATHSISPPPSIVVQGWLIPTTAIVTCLPPPPFPPVQTRVIVPDNLLKIWIRFNIEDGGTDERVLFVNATNATTDLTNALALDMTYGFLYYGQHNNVSNIRLYRARQLGMDRSLLRNVELFAKMFVEWYHF